MKWLDHRGILRPHLDLRYRIDWSRPAPSKGAQEVKNFLRDSAFVFSWYEEYRIPRTRLRIDFLCPELQIAIEFQGEQHNNYVKHMHGSKNGYLNSINRDRKKSEILEYNEIRLIEIYKEDLPLTKKWFREKHAIFF